MPYDLPAWVEAKIIPEPMSGCWLWLAALGTDGYGYVRLGRHRGIASNYPAHRFVYEFYKGPVASVLELDHLCRLRSCVNPDHLDPVSHQTNCIRGMGAAGRNARKTRCRNGHTLEDAYQVNGSRKCRVCQLANMARYYRRKHAT